jgi:hypothetical protein
MAYPGYLLNLHQAVVLAGNYLKAVLPEHTTLHYARESYPSKVADPGD